MCFYVCIRSNANLFWRSQPFIHTALSVSLVFSLKRALWWLVLNFWTHHPHRDGMAFNDGFQSNLPWLQYQALWKETFPPRNCRYPIPRTKERTFEKSWSHGHQVITERHQNPRQEDEILQAQVRLMASSYRRWRIRKESPMKPDHHVLSYVNAEGENRVNLNTCTSNMFSLPTRQIEQLC